jgi:transposase
VESLKAKYYRLPAYAPELNPIELVWAYLKHMLEKRTLKTDLLAAVKEILSSIDHDFIMDLYIKCGY